MDKDVLKFLHDQMQWVQEQGNILAQIETRLLVIKQIAHFRLEQDLKDEEINLLNVHVQQLLHEIEQLNGQMDNGIVH